MKNTIVNKNIIFTILLLFSIISISAQANPPNVITDSKSSNYYKVIHVKTIEGSYYDKKVYLHITVNGNTENKIVSVERSLDGTNFEIIGSINYIGIADQIDLAYYFTDESPGLDIRYYRLSGYSLNKELVYSKTIEVISTKE